VAKKFGIESIDFSSGEPTIHTQFKDIIATAKEMRFKDICVITNGLNFKDRDFMKECMDLGLNDILLSLHGPEAIQNKVIGVDDAYIRAIRTIENANNLNIRIRVNSVVCSMTYRNLPVLSETFKNLNIYNYNMIMFKYCLDQMCSFDFVKHSVSSKYIKQAIDNCKDVVKIINVRYIPFCFMRRYEKYVTNFHQKKYDHMEWNNALFFRFEDPENICLDFLDRNPVKENNDAIHKYSVCDYRKTDKCVRCRDFLICDGFENGYEEGIEFQLLTTTEEARPEPGKKIKDPLYYRRFNED
jgi:MoaA/NifB/PqqE/SkfB family radical SAM enzyme